MSPELIDKGETTCKADVYSYAVVLWEMLTRQIPFENYSVFQVLICYLFLDFMGLECVKLQSRFEAYVLLRF